MTGEWRYLDSGPRPGPENMALDEAVFEAHAEGLVPPTLRVYGWRPPAISLGRFQRVESAVDLEACQRLGLDVVRRPTGGRAILHTAEEVTFSFVISASRLGTTGVMDSYRRLSAGILAALRLLGLKAEIVERAASSTGASRPPSVSQDPACFAVKARCDLAVGGAKLVGSAQVQRKGFLLQQNSLPLRLALDHWPRVFLRPTLAPDAVGLWEAAGREISYLEVAAALRRGCAESFGLALEASSPTEAELRRAAQLAPKARIG